MLHFKVALSRCISVSWYDEKEDQRYRKGYWSSLWPHQIDYLPEQGRQNRKVKQKVCWGQKIIRK